MESPKKMKDRFCTTHWSVVLAVGGSGPEAGNAIRELCEQYYSPVLHYIERTIQGDASRIYGGRDARDLTHDFFSRVLEEKVFGQLKREGGRFRSYLLGAIKHFLTHVRESEGRVKRGGEIRHVSLNDDLLEDGRVDDAMFDRDWAQSILDSVYASLGNSVETRKFLPWITAELDGENRQKLTQELGMSDVAIKVALHRLRKRFRESIRNKVAETVESQEEIDGELEHLIRALRGK